MQEKKDTLPPQIVGERGADGAPGCGGFFSCIGAAAPQLPQGDRSRAGALPLARLVSVCAVLRGLCPLRTRCRGLRSPGLRQLPQPVKVKTGPQIAPGLCWTRCGADRRAGLAGLIAAAARLPARALPQIGQTVRRCGVIVSLALRLQSLLPV